MKYLKKLRLTDSIIVDVRSSAEFSTGSFMGAINIPLDELEERLDELEGENQIIVYCRSGSRSEMAKNILELNGYDNVINGININNLTSIINN